MILFIHTRTLVFFYYSLVVDVLVSFRICPDLFPYVLYPQRSVVSYEPTSLRSIHKIILSIKEPDSY